MKLIRTVIASVQEKIEQMKTMTKEEKKKIANSILKELKKIEGYQLPIVEAEKLYDLMCSNELQNLNLNKVDRIENIVNRQKHESAIQFANAIKYEYYDIDDIEELQELSKKITRSMINENPILIGQVNNKILSKISTIKRQQVINKIKNDIPPNITSVIEDLTSRNIDIQKANAIIDEEAKKRVESKPKTRFSLTEEQERRQILIQIRKTIVEKADEIYIKDPEKTILQIQKLCGGRNRTVYWRCSKKFNS